MFISVILAVLISIVLSYLSQFIIKAFFILGAKSRENAVYAIVAPLFPMIGTIFFMGPWVLFKYFQDRYSNENIWITCVTINFLIYFPAIIYYYKKFKEDYWRCNFLCVNDRIHI